MKLADLPSPPGVPVFGHLLRVEPARLHQQLEQWAQELGPRYTLRLGGPPLLVIGNHEAVSAALRDRPEGFRRTPRLEQIWRELGLPVGVFGANGESWARQRRMVMAGFDPAHVRRYYPAMQNVARRLAGRWERSIGQPIELQADLMRYTVDTIAGLAFGAEVNTLESDADVIQRHLDKLFPALYRRVLAPLPTWRWFKRERDRELEASIVEVKAAVAGFIAKARERMAAAPALREQPSNLLEAMIAAADVPGSGIDDELVAGNVLTMLLAGEDTTANTLAWMIHLLWRHPEALRRATDEVRGLSGSGLDVDTPTQEQLGALDFVEACIHETMRLKPVAPMLGLQAARDTTLDGVAVPAGTVVITLLRRDSVSDVHFEQADRFLPERWLDRDASAAKRIAMPFGAGPRICPGRYLAMLEIKLAMATLLGRFDIEAVDVAGGGVGAPELLSFTMAPQGLTMRLRRRRAN